MKKLALLFASMLMIAVSCGKDGKENDKPGDKDNPENTDASIFNRAASGSSVPMPMGKTFQTSMRFYETSSGSWAELSNIPNSAEGYGDLLEVTFAD